MNYFYSLKKPLITEKAMMLVNQGCYSFLVDPKANKSQIKKAIEASFGVHVRAIKTLAVQGKTRRTGRTRQVKKLSNQKKALVYLKPGETIKEFESQK